MTREETINYLEQQRRAIIQRHREELADINKSIVELQKICPKGGEHEWKSGGDHYHESTWCRKCGKEG